jgi:hypothetical protein
MAQPINLKKCIVFFDLWASSRAQPFSRAAGRAPLLRCRQLHLYA